MSDKKNKGSFYETIDSSECLVNFIYKIQE